MLKIPRDSPLHILNIVRLKGGDKYAEYNSDGRGNKESNLGEDKRQRYETVAEFLSKTGKRKGKEISQGG